MERGAPLAPGEYHLVIHVCIFNAKGKMLIQQRQPFKQGWPDLWDVTVSGSVQPIPARLDRTHICDAQERRVCFAGRKALNRPDGPIRPRNTFASCALGLTDHEQGAPLCAEGAIK